MSKFFTFVGYVVSVLAAAFGIVYLINKLTDKEIDEELCEEIDEECEDEAACDLADEDEAEVPLAE